MTSRKWYVLAAALVVLGVVLATTAFGRLDVAIDGLPRVSMPGQATIELPAGATTLYVEHRSAVAGESLSTADKLGFRCQVTDPAGAPVVLGRPTASVTYGRDGETGENVFDLHVAAAGTYTLVCAAPDPFVIAIGRGVGTQIVLLFVGAFVPAGLGVLVFVVVLARRGGQQRQARLATHKR